jgi:hypothetical protein
LLHHGYPLTCQDVLAIWWDDYVAIGAGPGGDISGALPGYGLRMGIFVLSGKDCWEKSCQPCLNVNVGFQTGMQEGEWTREHS